MFKFLNDLIVDLLKHYYLTLFVSIEIFRLQHSSTIYIYIYVLYNCFHVITTIIFWIFFNFRHFIVRTHTSVDLGLSILVSVGSSNLLIKRLDMCQRIYLPCTHIDCVQVCVNVLCIGSANFISICLSSMSGPATLSSINFTLRNCANVLVTQQGWIY